MMQGSSAGRLSWMVKVVSVVALFALIGLAGSAPALAAAPQPAAPQPAAPEPAVSQPAALVDGASQPNACLLPAPAPAAPQPLSCFFGANLIIIYYSDATHTHEVGECSQGPCPGAGCTGMKTSFATAHRGEICEICS